MEERTARRAARLGDDAAARLRNALRIRRNDRLLPTAARELGCGELGVDVVVRRAVLLCCTRDRSSDTSFSASFFCVVLLFCWVCLSGSVLCFCGWCVLVCW